MCRIEFERKTYIELITSIQKQCSIERNSTLTFESIFRYIFFTKNYETTLTLCGTVYSAVNENG